MRSNVCDSHSTRAPFERDDDHGTTARALHRPAARSDHRADDPGERPRRLGTPLQPARSCGVERLDADRPCLSDVPVSGRRVDGLQPGVARAAKGNCRKTLTGHIFLRTGKLLLLAFVLNFFPRMHWSMRFYGVIPRIAICSLLAGLDADRDDEAAKRQAAVVAGIVAVLLVGYWVLLRWVPVPGAGMPVRDVPSAGRGEESDRVDRSLVSWHGRSIGCIRAFCIARPATPKVC